MMNWFTTILQKYLRIVLLLLLLVVYYCKPKNSYILDMFHSIALIILIDCICWLYRSHINGLLTL